MFDTILLPAAQADTSPSRVQMSLRLRFNPLRNITPALLAQYLDSWRLGFFRNIALTWDAMERRDTRLQTVAPKRKKSVARLGWEILAMDDSPEALRQKAALEYFYNHLTATTALEPDERGGMSLLVRQMMDAVGKRYAVHEITWQPSPAGLTAQFTFCPLWWFEGVTGKLRYLPGEMEIYGQELNEWGWLVTVGDGIMEACSVAYMYKNLPLRDWLAYSEKFGTPGLLGETPNAKDSPEWDAMQDAIEEFASDWAAVVNPGSKISLVEPRNTADQPFKPLVDMMDEEMTRLWRGSDLGTSSKAHGTGASLQAGEARILEADDAQMIAETLTAQVSRLVLQYHFGDGPQLAYLKFKLPATPDLAQDVLVDEFLLAAGAPLSVKDALEKYGRPQPDGGGTAAKEQRKSEARNPKSEWDGWGGGHFVNLDTPMNIPIEFTNSAPERVEISILGKIPNPKLQAPEKLQAPSTKHAHPVLELGIWSFPGAWCLEIGASNPQFANSGPENTDVFVFNNTAAIQPDGWAQLAPFGDFPGTAVARNGDGSIQEFEAIQRLDRAAAETMAEKFRSPWEKLKRYLTGCWIFNGHPDMPNAGGKYPDREPKGVIAGLEVREDGLYCLPVFTDEGRELLSQGRKLFFSGRWTLEELPAENGRRIFRPQVLKSAGLTTRPNLPVQQANEGGGMKIRNPKSEIRMGRLNREVLAHGHARMDVNDGQRAGGLAGGNRQSPIAEAAIAESSGCRLPIGDTAGCQPAPPDAAVSRSAEPPEGGTPNPKSPTVNSPKTHNPIMQKKLILELLAAQGAVFANDATDEQLAEALKHLADRAAGADELDREKTTWANELAQLQSALQGREAELGALNQKLADAQTAFGNERAARIRSLLDDAITAGRITAAGRADWERRLAEDTAFANESAALARLPGVLKTASVLERAGQRKLEMANASQRRDAVLTLVHLEMERARCGYDAAYAKVQRENPALFAEMKQPGNA